MSRLAVYDIKGEIRGPIYKELIASMMPLAESFGFVVRSRSTRLSEKALKVFNELESCSISVHASTTWPGTLLVGGRTSMLYAYRLDPLSLEVLLSAASNLYDWMNPDLPEDLHLMRGDGSTVLGSVAQESDAWLELRPDEFAEWLNRASPRLINIVRETG